MFPFICNENIISNKVEITVIEIENLDDKVSQIIDNHFVQICAGGSKSDLQTVKLRVRNLFEKKDDRWKIGATAEFFVHLYFNLSDFKQDCLFLNLEEGSIKKGFDGVYSKDFEEWLMESKSGFSSTSHSLKIKEAMKDLEKKVSGKGSNNPWQNAYSHASHYDVNANEELKEKLRKMADDFTNGRYYEISQFNTMPCSTIFLSGEWIPKSVENLLKEITDIIDCLKGKQIHVVCITQKTVRMFLEYLNR